LKNWKVTLLAFGGAHHTYAGTVSLRQKNFHRTVASRRVMASHEDTACVDLVIELPHRGTSATEETAWHNRRNASIQPVTARPRTERIIAAITAKTPEK
jgi:hypothetical protein